MPGEHVMRAAMQEYIDAFRARDADRLIALFAQDAVVEDPVGSEPIQGVAAIAEFYRYAVQVVTGMSLAAPIRGSHANAAAMAFDIEMDVEGQWMKTGTIDVMEFDDDGKITQMRAYWGPSDASILDPG